MPNLGLSLGLGWLKAGGAGVSSGYAPVFTEYDGTDDVLIFGHEFGSDDNKGTVSFLFTSKLDGVRQRLLISSFAAVDIDKQVDNTIKVTIRSADPAILVQFTTTSTVTVADGQVHLLFAWTTDNSGSYIAKKNGVNMVPASITDDAGTINYTDTNAAAMGAVNGASLCTGCMSELYINTAEYQPDATMFANGNKGISLGPTGELPTTSQPGWYIPNLFTGVNLGSVSATPSNSGDPQPSCSDTTLKETSSSDVLTETTTGTALLET